MSIGHGNLYTGFSDYNFLSDCKQVAKQKNQRLEETLCLNSQKEGLLSNFVGLVVRRVITGLHIARIRIWPNSLKYLVINLLHQKQDLELLAQVSMFLQSKEVVETELEVI